MRNINELGKKDIISNNVKEILKEANKFLTLQEIYFLYNEKYDTSRYVDIESVIRNAIYVRCIERDLMDKNKEPLFFSLNPRKTIGNQYGLIEWSDKKIDYETNNDCIEKIIEHLPDKPDFDEFVLEKAPSKSIVKDHNYIIRRRRMMVKALVEADYSCEINNDHPSFIRKSNKKNYTEAHHLIPLKYQDEFEYTLDTSANIVSLCSNCHNQLHYGLEKEKILKELYEKRKEDLKKCMIEISYEKLCEYYGLKKD